MENKDYSTNDVLIGAVPAAQEVPAAAPTATSFSASQQAPLAQGAVTTGLSVKPGRLARRSWKIPLALSLITVGIIVIGFLGYRQYQMSRNGASATVEPSSAFAIQDLDLNDLIVQGDAGLSTTQSLSINGQLRTNNSLVLAPRTQPTTASAGQIYYDQTANGLAYYDGTSFVPLVAGQEVALLRTQLQGVQASVPSLPTDLVTLGGQNTFRGTNTFNSGLATSSLTTSGSTTLQGSLAVSGPATLGAATISNLILSSPLSVSSGGTGATSFTTNGVLIGQGGAPIAAVTAAGPNLCLMSTAGAPTFSACPGGGGAGVDSLNGLTGSLTIANATAAGVTVTLDNASTSAKGIASFNAANFTVTSGAVNTIQDISVTASPTFANVTATTLAGAGSGITNLSASNVATGTLSDARLSVNVPLLGAATNNFTGTLQHAGNTVCDNSNNCNYLTGSAANGAYIQLQVGTPGTPQTGHFNISGTGRATALYQNGNQVCDTTGNCAGLGGGLVGTGTNGTIAKFTGTGSLGNSLLTESGITVTVGGDLFATNFSGNGSAVTNVNAAQLGGQVAGYYLNATNITAGTLADVRLTANVTLQGNTFNGSNQLVQLNAFGQLPAISGALLTNLNGSNVTSGTVADARLSANIPLLGAATNNFTGALQRAGNTVCDNSNNCNYLTGSVANGAYIQLQGVTPGTAQTGHINITGTAIAGSFSGDGSTLTNLNASNIASGTLLDARLSSNVALVNAATVNFVGALQQGGNNVCTVIGNCTDAGVTLVGLVDGQTKNTNGATIVGATIYLQTADASSIGLMSTTAQAFAGVKTFNNNILAGGNVGINNATPISALAVNAYGTGSHDTAAYINTGSASRNGLVLQVAAGQTANPFVLKSSSGGTLAFIGANADMSVSGSFISGNGIFGSESLVGASSTGAVFRSGGASGVGNSSGSVTLRSGTATSGSSSGDVIIDAGGASTTAGNVTIAVTQASSITMGRSGITMNVPSDSLFTGTSNTVRVNSATALLVQNTSLTSLLTVDTNAMKVTVRELEVTLNLTVGGHYISGGATPGLAAGAAACTSPTVSIAGTDTAGRITVTTGTGCATSGILATVTFASAFSTLPRVSLTPATATAATLPFYIASGTLTLSSFDVATTATPASSTAYTWYYHALQ